MTKSQIEDAVVSKSELLNVVKNKSLGWHSIGSKLFLLVFVSALVGLGSMSYFFYQALEKRAREQITSNLRTHTRLIEGKLGRAEQTMLGIVSAAKTLQRMGVKEPDAYKQLVLDVLEQRTPLTVGAGIGQAPFQILPE
ncbi:hypothetical protein IQ238_27840, partial [Pleurocapsales cyanobacterium LEGE 06147]|nr:hypothetical protein [Pleurocapsales cyanobacterium LEGE 06147]